MQVIDRADQEKEIVALLSSDAAEDFLRLALAGIGDLAAWSLHTINHRPGAGVSAGYSVEIATATGRRDEYVVASTAKVNEVRLRETGGVTLTAGERRLHVWLHPNDPELPALPLGCDPAAMADFIGEPCELELVGYRPTRRAVVRVLRPGKPIIYAKVVRPDVGAELISRLEMLEGAQVPSPKLLGTDSRGLVVTSSLPGTPMGRLLATRPIADSLRLLSALDATLDSLPQEVRVLRRRPAWLDRCEHYADAASVVLPDEEQRIRQVAGDIRRLEQLADFGPVVATHGDFYEANILVNPDTLEVSGVLDVDNVGAGYRVNDWGCMLGHLSILPGVSDTKYGHTTSMLDEWAPIVDTLVDPVALCASSAGTVLSLVAGARKSRKKDWRNEAQFRLRIAEDWIRRGDAALALPR